MTKRYAGEPLREVITQRGSTIFIHSGGRPEPSAQEMVKRINEHQQPGLSAKTTKDPDKIEITYDSYDDLGALRSLMLKTTWRF